MSELHSKRFALAAAMMESVLRSQATLLTQNQSPKSCGLIVISGSGTSGRLAFLLALEFNRILVAQGLYPCFRHLIAGGDRAILKSAERAEDQSRQGTLDLLNVIAANEIPVSQVVYVGVTCGLTATFVGAQLDYCQQQYLKQQQRKLQPMQPEADETGPAPISYRMILLGFNPVSSMKDIRIANWDRTFREVVIDFQRIAADHPEDAVILNPCVGPEAICGSTRMKGGSATKILLEALAATALTSFLRSQQAHSDPQKDITSNSVQGNSMLHQFRRCYEDTYRE